MKLTARPKAWERFWIAWRAAVIVLLASITSSNVARGRWVMAWFGLFAMALEAALIWRALGRLRSRWLREPHKPLFLCPRCKVYWVLNDRLMQGRLQGGVVMSEVIRECTCLGIDGRSPCEEPALVDIDETLCAMCLQNGCESKGPEVAKALRALGLPMLPGLADMLEDDNDEREE